MTEEHEHPIENLAAYALGALEGPEQTARYWDALWPLERRAEFGWADLFKAPLQTLFSGAAGA